jgi:hypothetical protein
MLFTAKEWDYLRKLEKRNHGLLSDQLSPAGKEQSVRLWDPLEKPMSVEERKIRSSIRRKMSSYAKELAFAFHCGMLPQKQLLEVGVHELDTMVYLFKGLVWLEFLRMREDIKEIAETKYIQYGIQFAFGSAGGLIANEARRLRQAVREKNPDTYDQIEKELEAEREKLQKRRKHID